MTEGDGYLRSLHSFLLDKFVPLEDFFDCVVPGSLEEAGCPDTFDSSTGKDIGQIRILFEGINRNGCVVAADGIRSAARLSLSEWIENKIDVFTARIEGWQIGIAKEIINKKIPHRGFALLHIVFSYFEMIGKYVHGYIGNDKSKYYFGKGVEATLEVTPTEEAFLQALYSSVRNGLYHLGMTKINVMLRDDIPGSIAFNSERNILAICPDRLVEDLDIRFHDYVSELRNPKNVKLRENFEKRFDHDNSETSL